MSSEQSIPEWGPNDLSPEDVRRLWQGCGTWRSNVSIPDWHKELIDERMARYCETGIKGTPWEEFEKELLEQLMKG